jgi:hypothetical protein
MTKLNRIDASVNQHPINEVALTAQEASRPVGIVAVVGGHFADLERDSANGAAIALGRNQRGHEFGAMAGAPLSRAGVRLGANFGVLVALLVSLLRASLGLWRQVVSLASLNVPGLLIVSSALRFHMWLRGVGTALRAVALRVCQASKAMVFKMGSPLLRSCGRFCESSHARSITPLFA